MKIIRVENCTDCLWGDGLCYHPMMATRRQTKELGVPDWCPLETDGGEVTYITEKERDLFAISFANWLDTLTPVNKVSVWSKNGEYRGLFDMDNERLLERFKEAQPEVK